MESSKNVEFQVLQDLFIRGNLEKKFHKQRLSLQMTSNYAGQGKAKPRSVFD